MHLPFGELPEIELSKLCATSASGLRRIRISATVSASWRSTTGDMLRLLLHQPRLLAWGTTARSTEDQAPCTRLSRYDLACLTRVLVAEATSFQSFGLRIMPLVPIACCFELSYFVPQVLHAALSFCFTLSHFAKKIVAVSCATSPHLHLTMRELAAA